ncbi:MAG: hypothetical protein EHM72_20080, partial [Calditrichaeota bacterium]
MVGCLGIRREDKNVWERRTPLIPQHIHQLIRDHRIQVIVQPQENRAFSNAEYAAAGAEVSADLSPCDLILAVKEIPADQILSNKALLFFSHTLKGQRQNMPMLRRILALGNTLIDYECIKDDSGKRVVFFGRYAGMAGMIETLHALGRRLTDVGIKTALAEINSAHQYASLDEAKLHIVNIGDRIRKTGLPPEICPLVCGFCGYGNVSVGAQEIFDLLPVHNVDPDSLPLLAAEPGNIFYKVVFHERHTVAAHQPVDDFVLEHYWAHPQQYRSVFDRYLPYLTLVLNGV